VSGTVRLLSIAEQTTGMFYVTVLIARLVGLYSSEGAADVKGSVNDANQNRNV